MLKLKMMLCVMMLPLVVIGCIKAVCQSVREATTASGVDKYLPDWRTPLNGIISPSKLICQKQLKEPKYINEAVQIGCPYRWATHAIIVVYTRAQPEYKCLQSIKPASNPFTNVCWVSVLTTFSAPPQILAAST